MSVVIPAYNEAATIHLILDRINNIILEGNVQKEIIIVDDCSKDKTEDAVNRFIEKHPDCR